MSELTESQKQDALFITRPNFGPGWPNWPFLPVKRYVKEKSCPECGVIVDMTPLGERVDPKNECYRTVRVGANLFDLIGTLGKSEKKVYASVEEMLADDWQVD